MEKIVTEGMKIDLHIHSQVSSSKDGDKVKNNTKDSITLLISKLNENGVNICSITDHDAFSFEMYSALKTSENKTLSIKKVLPGVEFSVQFSVDGIEKVIHTVAIFSDANEEKIKNIENVLKCIRPHNGTAYTEEEFLDVLRKIDIDTILIAHQKNTLTSKTPRKNDANSLGQNKFLEFIYTDYFEAFEFKNKRNEVLNKSFIVSAGLEDDIRFITGTDCHDWSYYPREDASDISTEFPFTYAKCLPTFKGLVMAITDHKRLKTVNSFFNVDKQYVESIDIKIHGDNAKIPLSRGINVIIGDNSIGKSMLLHAMTNYSKNGIPLKADVKKGYKKYLEKNQLGIITSIPQENVFCFDMQGEVRSKFEENKLNAAEFLSAYFPPNVDPKPYRNIIENEIRHLIEYLQKKFTLAALISNLTTFKIKIVEDKAESLTFISNLRASKKRTQHISAISSRISEIIGGLKELQKMELDQDDLDYIIQTVNQYQSMKRKYDERIHAIDLENDRIEKVAKVISKISDKHKRSVTDNQKSYSAFTEATSGLTQQLVEIINKAKELSVYAPHVDEVEITPNRNKVYDYEFISKLSLEKINTDYFVTLINSLLKAGKSINWETITESQLQDMLVRYDNDVPVLEFAQDKLREKLDADFLNKNSIIYQGMDKFDEMSSGLDAKIYFDLLSYESSKDGVYIIDQPEDNISQSAIKTYLLDRFKTMGENRQIIMVTHNPQFIVNLDVDNLIFIFRDGETIKVQSGALEYSCDEYNILDIIAKNIDGGLDTIQKRWKRYEKVANV